MSGLAKLTPREELRLHDRHEDQCDARDRHFARRDRVGEMAPVAYATFGGAPESADERRAHIARELAA